MALQSKAYKRKGWSAEVSEKFFETLILLRRGGLPLGKQKIGDQAR